MKAFAPIRTVAPGVVLISTADAKAHLRVDGTAEDDYIADLVAAATQWLDGYAGVLGRALITQTWQQKFDGFPSEDRFRLPLGPLGAVSSISYRDSADAEQSFTGFTAMGDEIGPLVILNENSVWPSTYDRPDAVTVTWTCGYGASAADVPAQIIVAAKMLIGQWYDQRSMSSDVGAVMALIGPLRAVGL